MDGTATAPISRAERRERATADTRASILAAARARLLADGYANLSTRAVAEALRKATGQEVELQARADPALVGGLLVKMAGRTYDGTVRGRLRALRQRLVGPAGNP